MERDQTETTRQSILNSAGKNSLNLTELQDRIRYRWLESIRKTRQCYSVTLKFSFKSI